MHFYSINMYFEAMAWLLRASVLKRFVGVVCLQALVRTGNKNTGRRWSEEPNSALLNTRQDIMHENQRREIITWSMTCQVTPSLLYQVSWRIRLRGNQQLPIRKSLDAHKSSRRYPLPLTEPEQTGLMMP